MKQYAFIFGGIAVIGIIIVFLLFQGLGNKIIVNQKPTTTQNPQTQTTPASTSTGSTQTQATTSAIAPVAEPNPSVIGTSVEGREIKAYHYGTGSTELLFIGGIHGGYSWNTSAVAFQLIDYLAQNPDSIPSNLKVTVIPVLNPDGLYKIAGTAERVTASDITVGEANTVAGRFNANTVDLNRNFDCDWQSTGVWQKQTVSGGKTAFSEPEAQAVRDYVASHDLKAVVAWYSAAGGVFSSNCHNGVLPETTTLTDLFARASGYKAYENFDFYTITGDMMNWLAKKNIPAISVLLTNHQDTEWSKNLAGIQAVFDHYKE